MNLQRRWLKVAAEVTKTVPDVPAIACPSCGEHDIQYQYVGDPATRIGFLMVWSAACSYGIHLSRVGVPAGVDMIPFDAAPAVLRARVPNFREVE